MLKKIIYGLIIIAIAAFFIWRYFIYFDWQIRCFIRIQPSFLEFSNLTMQKAIRILKNASPDDYRDLCQYVNVINPNISCGGFEGGCYSVYKQNPKMIDVSTSNRSLQWTVGIIVHETCHAKQFQQHRDFGETECYDEDSRIIKAITEF